MAGILGGYKSRAIPSLMLAIPTLIIGLAINISLAMLLVLFRDSLLIELLQ